MAIGMTLNQLYAPSSSSSPRSPNDQADAKPSLHYQLPYSNTNNTQQYTAPYPSTSTSSSMQFVSKPGPSTSEDYAADPLPFEYARKYSPSQRDDESRSSSTSGPQQYNNADSYAPQSAYAQSRYTQPTYPEPRSYHHDMNSQSHFPRSTQMYNPMPTSMLPLPTTSHSFPPLLDAATKKEVDAYPSYGEQRQPMVSSGTAQEAMIKVKTPLKLKYWRNGRRNLQCFPSCKVFGDYSAIKIQDLKQHDFMWGKCRGSLVTEVTLNSNVTFDDLVLLGRVHSLENIPVAFEEAVIRECMLGRTVEIDEMDAMKDQWISGERLPDFVQQDGNVACFEFKPKVWKYTEDMAQGKCKRRNVKYYVQFEAFVQMAAGDRRYFACIGSGMSTSFEVGSSRVLARQKRKAADAATKTGHSDVAITQQPVELMQHNPNPVMHNVMATHPMSNQMYAPAYHHDAQTRGLPTFPHPQMMMNQMPPQQQMQPEMHYSMQQQLQPPLQQQQQQQPQLSSPQHSSGEKRKMSSERPAFPTDRASKMLKPMSGVAQSVPF